MLLCQRIFATAVFAVIRPFRYLLYYSGALFEILVFCWLKRLGRVSEGSWPPPTAFVSPSQQKNFDFQGYHPPLVFHRFKKGYLSLCHPPVWPLVWRMMILEILWVKFKKSKRFWLLPTHNNNFFNFFSQSFTKIVGRYTCSHTGGDIKDKYQ